jgi:glycine dehydrogenase subunit 2
MSRDRYSRFRKFHQAKWDEEIIFELSVPGERGVLVPKAEAAVADEIGDGVSYWVVLSGKRRLLCLKSVK